MTAQSVTQSSLYSRAAARQREATKFRLNVRMDLLVARLMVAVGLGLPALMVFHVLPASLVLLGIGLGLIMAGGIVALIRCGEVA